MLGVRGGDESHIWRVGGTRSAHVLFLFTRGIIMISSYLAHDRTIGGMGKVFLTVNRVAFVRDHCATEYIILMVDLRKYIGLNR